VIILQNCQIKKKKKNVYTFCLVFEKIQRNYRIVLLSHFHDSLEKHVSSK
jgi:hypothetical protein